MNGNQSDIKIEININSKQIKAKKTDKNSKIDFGGEAHKI